MSVNLPRYQNTSRKNALNLLEALTMFYLSATNTANKINRFCDTGTPNRELLFNKTLVDFEQKTL